MTADNVGMDFGKEPPAGLVMTGRQVVGTVKNFSFDLETAGLGDQFENGPEGLRLRSYQRDMVAWATPRKATVKIRGRFTLAAPNLRPSRGYARHIRRQKAFAGKGLRK